MPFADPDFESPIPISLGRRAWLGALALGAGLLALGVAPYGLAAIGGLLSGDHRDWAILVVAALPLTLIALIFAAILGACSGKSRPATICLGLLVADFAAIAWFWA